MIKRFFSAVLAASLSLSLLCMNTQASSIGSKAETVQALGILVGDGSGNTALSSQTTRAQFAKMLVAASVYKDSAGSCSASLFKDLKGTHWSSGYVRTAVEQGWMSGYTDGTFRPDQPITLEEGCAALLKLLGYDASSLKGSYPTAQLSKAGSIGLLDGVTASRGARLTRQNCVELFYNLLTVTTSSGAVYGTTIGCTVVNGQVDYSALIADQLEGPYIAQADGELELPFAPEDAAVIFYDGAASTMSAVRQYDVYYYHENTRTVWVYNDRVIGALSEVSPNRVAPESVTVAGQSYQLENSAAAQKVSGLKDDETITLLLDMNGQAVDILQGIHGELDDDAYLAVVNSDTKGPYVALSGSLDLPFDQEEAALYYNGSPAGLSSIQQYDVYYYNSTLQTVWVYSDRVIGALSAVSPDRISPESVTVAGQSYPLEDSAVVQKLSGFHEDETVTLLLGMDGQVADILHGVHGELDSDTYLAVVHSDTKGPYIAASSVLELPFDSSTADIYRNGSPALLSSVQKYDVYYYNPTLQTVWIYNNRITGTLTGISPNTEAPSAVTVAGVSYPLETSEASLQFSSQGSFQEGDMVTLLLGMSGEVVRAIDPLENEAVYYGSVVSSTKAASTSSTASTATASAQVSTQVACTDGVLRTFYHSGTARSAGSLVTVTITQTGTNVKNMSVKKLEGTVNQDGTGLGNYNFAAGVQILDTDENGGYARIYPSRLAGVKLSGNDIRGYTLDANGDIDRLVLRNVTGDTRPYVYISGIEDNSSETNISVSYTYIQDGQVQTVSGGAKYAVKTGGAALLYEKGVLKRIRQLDSVSLDSLSALGAMGDGKEYKLAEHVQVLLRDSTSSQSFYLTELSQVNGEDYKLTGWYDNLGFSAGGRIRIIVAAPK